MARSHWTTLFAALALAACSGTTPPGTDAGSDAAVAPDAYLTPDSCDMDHVHRLDGMAGGTVSLDLDTTMSTTRPRDLGANCGNPAPDIRWAPQEVIEFHVPGTGMQGVSFTTDVAATTPSNINTVVQIRSGGCRTIPTTTFPPSCFDDVSTSDLRAKGGVTVMGGTTLYFFVTGYSNPPATQMSVDEGTIHIDISVAPNTPPTLTTAQTVFAGVDTRVLATATDPEGPIVGFTLLFYNAGGIIDIYGDGTADAGDAWIAGFTTVDRAAPMYTGHGAVDGTNVADFVDYCHAMGVDCTQIGVRVFDEYYAMSNEVMVAAADAIRVGQGGTCDFDHICGDGQQCSPTTCAPTAAASSACLSTMELTIPAPTTTATSTMVGGSVGAGAGTFVASCGQTDGREAIYHLAIPAGDFDLDLTTDVGGATADTVLYVRHACADGTSELPMGCDDDINYPSNPRSHLNFHDLASGDYYVFIEGYGSGGGATSYHLQATLTPVLATGAACDPAMSNYRCANGACDATAHTCP